MVDYARHINRQRKEWDDSVKKRKRCSKERFLMKKEKRKKNHVWICLMLVSVMLAGMFPMVPAAAEDIPMEDTHIEDIHEHEEGAYGICDGENAHIRGSLHEAPECGCKTETDVHEGDCPRYVEPMYTEITDMMDALPLLTEVKTRNLEGVRDADQKVQAVQNKIRERSATLMGGTETDAFNNELGEERTEKFNDLVTYISDYLRNNSGMMQLFSAATATRINIANGRVVVRSTGATQYNGATNTVRQNIAHNADGYLFYGTATFADTQSFWAAIKVTEGITVQLYLENINLKMNTGACVDVTGANTTITLVDGTENILTADGMDGGVPGWGSGALVKNDSLDTYRLTIRCEKSGIPDHLCSDPGSTCGKLSAIGITQHTTAIGSAFYGGLLYFSAYGNTSFPSNSGLPFRERGGFANLYIEGGIITARGGLHTPGIGAMCGVTWIGNTVHGINTTNPQVLRGQMCKNINITGGVVNAYGGEGCAGIGSGWAGPVDGIYINGGAHVYAEGGRNSPGIGSGGVDEDVPRPTVSMRYNVSNINISGGKTVVEAIGFKGGYVPNDVGNLVWKDNNCPYQAFPTGIGRGLSYSNLDSATGTINNVQAEPEPNWLTMVKQGTARANAVFVSGSPNPSVVQIATNQYYNLVYFSQIAKTASVNGAPNEPGTAANPVSVRPGDTVRYTIDTANWADGGGTTTYELRDVIPAGMTLVAGQNTANMQTRAADTGSGVEVYWTGQTVGATFYFTVTVNPITTETTYINNARAISSNITMYSNSTYHRATMDANTLAIQFIKVDMDQNPLGNAQFALYACTNNDPAHITGNHGTGACTWNTSAPVTTATSDAYGNVVLSTVPYDRITAATYYVLVETAAPQYYITPSGTSYILVRIATTGAVTFTEHGDFSANYLLDYFYGELDERIYRVKNQLLRTEIYVKKEIKDFNTYSAQVQNELAQQPFIINLNWKEGAEKASVVLKHNETSLPLVCDVRVATTTLNIWEIVPMEYTTGYTVKTEITPWNGSTSTEVDGRQITIRPGDTVEITVTNTFEHKPFFKAWDWRENRFGALL